jgi:hypothetical protein
MGGLHRGVIGRLEDMTASSSAYIKVPRWSMGQHVYWQVRLIPALRRSSPPIRRLDH